MDRLVGRDRGSGKLAEVCVRCDDLPVGKHVRIRRGPVDPVRVEPDHLFSARKSDQGLASRLDQAPGSGHGDQVAPRVELISIPDICKSTRLQTILAEL